MSGSRISPAGRVGLLGGFGHLAEALDFAGPHHAVPHPLPGHHGDVRPRVVVDRAPELPDERRADRPQRQPQSPSVTRAGS